MLRLGRTNPEYNLRHDWNSLLVPEELTATVRPFTNYTDAYYPSADIYVEYLRDYAKTYGDGVACACRFGEKGGRGGMALSERRSTIAG